MTMCQGDAMTRCSPVRGFGLAALLLSGFAVNAAEWAGGLTPIGTQDWNAARAAHLLERAGFGGTPEEIALYAANDSTGRGPAAGLPQDHPERSAAFDDSGAHDPGLNPSTFPAGRNRSRQEDRRIPRRQKSSPRAIGACSRLPTGFLLAARQPAGDASPRLLVGEPHACHPTSPGRKDALFWHGHFATNEEKVRDYRKMLKQLEYSRTRHRQLSRAADQRRRTRRCSPSSTPQ